jgi:RNA polymerase sigma factor (sigma-70 family)
VTNDSRVVQKLRGVASRLTRDPELRKDLMQEMFLHLVRVQGDRPGQTQSWYVQSCEYQARNYLKLGRSVDSHKRASRLIPFGQAYQSDDGSLMFVVEATDPLDLHAEVAIQDIVDLMTTQLTEQQRRILFMLIKGFGVREIARLLQVSHPAVVKHRRKIAGIARALMAEPPPTAENEAVLAQAI